MNKFDQGPSLGQVQKCCKVFEEKNSSRSLYRKSLDNKTVIASCIVTKRNHTSNPCLQCPGIVVNRKTMPRDMLPPGTYISFSAFLVHVCMHLWQHITSDVHTSTCQNCRHTLPSHSHPVSLTMLYFLDGMARHSHITQF